MIPMTQELLRAPGLGVGSTPSSLELPSLVLTVLAWFPAAPPASLGSGLAGLGLGPSQPWLWPEA